MTAIALIMAGGLGLRMRESNIDLPKPLVPVLGVSLLERNIHALLRHRIAHIAIALPQEAHEIENHIALRIEPLTKAAGVTLDVFVEDRPLGNIGCAGNWKSKTETLLVIYTDNLTTLDLSDVLAAHTDSCADLTLATHSQPFHMPFGEVEVVNDEVRAYVEKPIHSFPVCSAISVLGPRAMESLPNDRPTGLSTLAQSLIDSGGNVRAFSHSKPWIDVNDALAIKEAEKMVAANHQEFNIWASHPTAHRAASLVLSGGSALLISGSPEGRRWSLPIFRQPLMKCNGMLSKSCSDEIEGHEPAWSIFDDLDDTGSCICRFHIYLTPPTADEGLRNAAWRPLKEISMDPDITIAVRRAVALAEFQQRYSHERS